MKTTAIGMLWLLAQPSLAIGATPVTPGNPVPGAESTILGLPIAFEPNQGQSDPSVKFLAHDLSGAGPTLLLTADSAIFQAGGNRDSAIRMKIVGAREAIVSGADPLSGRANYFIGNVPNKWITGAPTYRRVVYGQIYSGVDLFFYGSQRQLEYDFVVAPGAGTDQIALEFREPGHGWTRKAIWKSGPGAG
ncbi:MAG TPA: hypothetical protein VMB03_16185 [Bryobacteraceae bacterium]|nr:hypothetical protein [Bryobacteraceae bacterium]